MKIKFLSGDAHLSLKDHILYFITAVSEIFRSLTLRSQAIFFMPKIKSASLIDEPSSPFRILQEAFFREILAPSIPTPVKILDVGCGRGQNYKIFQEQKIRGTYMGIDLGRSDKGALSNNVADDWKEIVDQTRDSHLQCEFRLHSLFKISDLGRMFNCIFSSSVLEHIDNPQLAIEELNKVLEHGGIQAHTAPAPFSYFLYGPHGYHRFLPLELKNLFNDENKEIRTYAFGGTCSYFIHFLLVTFPIIVLKRDIRKSIPNLYNKALYYSILLDRFMPFLHVGYAVVAHPKK